MEERKKDHIELALDSQTYPQFLDNRFDYEPLLSAFPADEEESFEFLGKSMRVPIWVSSMTGGTKMAGIINRNLARACKQFGMGMGLGSCRIIMDDKTYFEDFNLRPILGEDVPFYANLGIAQVEKLLGESKADRIKELIDDLKADGLVVHVNPLQEWCQPEGDQIHEAPLETLNQLLGIVDFPVIVKEVGQGFGPESLTELLKLPVEAIEFAAFGGTNFSLVELTRADDETKDNYRLLPFVGHTAEEMTRTVNTIVQSEEVKCRQLIISGGIRGFLDGYYLTELSELPAIYGQASAFLRHARADYSELESYVNQQVRGLRIAKAYLRIKKLIPRWNTSLFPVFQNFRKRKKYNLLQTSAQILIGL